MRGPSPQPSPRLRGEGVFQPEIDIASWFALSPPLPVSTGEGWGAGYSVHCRSSLPSANRIALWQEIDRVGTTDFMIFLHADSLQNQEKQMLGPPSNVTI